MTEYAQEQTIILKELGIWPYLTPEQLQRYDDCKTDSEVRMLVALYRDTYWDKMLEDYERDANRFEALPDELISNTKLNARIKNALKKNKFKKMSDYLNYIQDEGWSTVVGFGQAGATEVFRYLFPTDTDEEIERLVLKYKEFDEDE